MLGDVNLNFLEWKKDSTSYNLHEFSELIFDKIFPRGVVQCIREATHFWPGRETSGLDHLYTNYPTKLSQPMLITNGGSDHKMIMCARYTRNIVAQQRIILKRSYKNFDSNIFLEEVRALIWLLQSCPI